MKNYTTFLSEQVQILNEKSPDGKLANLASRMVAGLGDNASDTVVSDMGSVNPLLRNDNNIVYSLDFVKNLPSLWNEYSEAQLKQIFNNMGSEERRRTDQYVNSLKSFKNSQTVGKLYHSLEKYQVTPEKFLPKRYGNWTNER